MDELLSEFLTEAAESLSVLDVELVQLERDPNDPDLLSNIFRLVHTIKGTCGFLGLPRLEAVAHAGENILGRFRDRHLTVTPTGVSLILEALDCIKWLLSELEATGGEPAGNDQDLIDRLNDHAEGRAAAAAEAAPAEPAEAEAAAEPEATEASGAVAAADCGAPAAVDSPFPVAQELLDEFEAALGAGSAPAVPAADPAPAAPPAQAVKSPAEPTAEPQESAHRREGSPVSQQSIRVSVDLLEHLMTMVSELVLTRNQLLQIVRHQAESEFTGPLQRLNHVVSELQEGVMKTRMQPIGNAWAKLPRIVRDLAQELDKKIDLVMTGSETELDRQVLELIKDPLTHMVRNSADHGIEAPADRAMLGKPETGSIHLAARHEGGHIIITIGDNGKGLNKDKIAAKALREGLVSDAALAEMNDQQIYQLIFRAGFSTADQVTSVSGRGVGMDVVRTNIERIGGTIELTSNPGHGTTFTIKIPLTLAIVSALIVQCDGERFAIPQLSVIELVRSSADGQHRIERIKGRPVLRLRDHLLPLISLSSVLGQKSSEVEANDSAHIIVVQVGSTTFGIAVDRVFDTEEIVVKPVSPVLRDLPIYAGNTILGDGSVVLILDPNGIASVSQDLEMSGSDAQTVEVAGTSTAAGRTSLLLLKAGYGAPKAVPLSLVARLEEVEVERIEHVQGQMMLQYRGQLMPLIPADHSMMLKTEGKQSMIVFSDGERSMGLMVDEIIDIIEDEVDIRLTDADPGIMGRAVVAGHATELIDVAHYLSTARRDWFSAPKVVRKAKSRVLLIDDSAFFAGMVAPILRSDGHDVTVMTDPLQAVDRVKGGDVFDLVITDIEMPGLSGYELSEQLRTEPAFADVPIIALSSHVSPRDLQRGREAGFNEHLPKFDRQALLDTVRGALEMQG